MANLKSPRKETLSLNKYGNISDNNQELSFIISSTGMKGNAPNNKNDNVAVIYGTVFVNSLDEILLS